MGSIAINQIINQIDSFRFDNRVEKVCEMKIDLPQQWLREKENLITSFRCPITAATFIVRGKTKAKLSNAESRLLWLLFTDINDCTV